MAASQAPAAVAVAKTSLSFSQARQNAATAAARQPGAGRRPGSPLHGGVLCAWRTGREDAWAGLSGGAHGSLAADAASPALCGRGWQGDHRALDAPPCTAPAVMSGGVMLAQGRGAPGTHRAEGASARARRRSRAACWPTGWCASRCGRPARPRRCPVRRSAPGSRSPRSSRWAWSTRRAPRPGRTAPARAGGGASSGGGDQQGALLHAGAVQQCSEPSQPSAGFEGC